MPSWPPATPPTPIIMSHVVILARLVPFVANHDHHRCYAGDMLSSILPLKPVLFYGFIGGKLGNLPVLIICSLVFVYHFLYHQSALASDFCSVNKPAMLLTSALSFSTRTLLTQLFQTNSHHVELWHIVLHFLFTSLCSSAISCPFLLYFSFLLYFLTFLLINFCMSYWDKALLLLWYYDF